MSSSVLSMGKKKKRSPETCFGTRELEAFVANRETLDCVIADEDSRDDFLASLVGGLQRGGWAAAAPPSLRLGLLQLLESRGTYLLRDAPLRTLRILYELLRDVAAAPATARPPAAAALRAACDRALTAVVAGLDLPARDARLARMHVQMLYRRAADAQRDPRMPSAAWRAQREAAADCLRELELAFPGLLLSGAGDLLVLWRRERGRALGPACCQLAVTVLSHGAGRYVEQRLGPELDGCYPAAQAYLLCRTGPLPAPFDPPLTPLPSPTCVADLRGGAPGADSSQSSCAALSAAADAETPSSAVRTPQALPSLTRTDSATSSLQALDRDAYPSSTAVQLLGSSAGLLRFRVPESCRVPAVAPVAPASPFCWSVPPAPAGSAGRGYLNCEVLLAPNAQQELHAACLAFLAALPLLPADRVAGVGAQLPPLLRAAALSGGEAGEAQLRAAMGSLLCCARFDVVAAALEVHDAAPEVLGGAAAGAAALRCVNDPTLSCELRALCATWVLRAHHRAGAGASAGGQTLLQRSWRHLLPLPADDATLLVVKAKALAACLASGAGDPWACAQVLSAWDGLWRPAPAPRELRAAALLLRTLWSAADSGRRVPELRACMVALLLQIMATRPQYTPAVLSFLSSCPCPLLVRAALRSADALFASVAELGELPALELRLGAVEEASTWQRLASPAAGLAQQLGGALYVRSKSWAAGLQRSFGAARASLLGTRGDEEGPLARSSSARYDRDSAHHRGSFHRCSSQSDLTPGAVAPPPRFRFGAGPPASAPLSASVAAGSGAAGAAAPEVAAVVEAAAELLRARAARRGAAVPSLPRPSGWRLACWPDAEAWLASPGLWDGLAACLAARDPLLCRGVMLCVARCHAVVPRGTLALLASYARQYSAPLAGQDLSDHEVGGVLLAICKAAALAHLPVAARPASPDEDGEQPGGGQLRAGPGWTRGQEAVADGAQAVLDAVSERFPDLKVRHSAHVLSSLLGDEAAWQGGDAGARCAALGALLADHLADGCSLA